MIDENDNLWGAIQAKDWEKLKRLANSGMKENFEDIDHKDYALIFEVIWSQDEKSEDMALWWLDHGYPAAIRGGRCRINILHAAAANGMPRLIEKVLTKTDLITVNTTDCDRNAPIWHAACHGRTECVKTLLKLGANPNGIDEDSEPDPARRYNTPLHVAANTEIARLLLDAGASLSSHVILTNIFRINLSANSSFQMNP